MRHVDFDTNSIEGLAEFQRVVGYRVAKAALFSFAWGMGADKLKARVRDDILCFARAALSDDTLPATAVGAFSSAVECGVVFG